MRGTTEDEKALLAHVMRWGSDGYPVHKGSRGWTWGEFLSIKGPPVVFKTKRECVESLERFLFILREAYGEERQAEAAAQMPQEPGLFGDLERAQAQRAAPIERAHTLPLFDAQRRDIPGQTTFTADAPEHWGVRGGSTDNTNKDIR